MKENLKKICLIVLFVACISSIWIFGFSQGVSWGWKANLPSPFEKIINKEAPLEISDADMGIFWDT